jgi:hypothetical protein
LPQIVIRALPTSSIFHHIVFGIEDALIVDLMLTKSSLDRIEDDRQESGDRRVPEVTMKKFAFSFAVIAAFLVVGVNNLFAQARLASRFGEAMVGGRRLIVHVTVAVPDGWDENAVTENALRDHRARPIQHSEFSLESIRWDQFSNDPSSSGAPVSLHYNPAGEPVSALTSLTSAENTWNNVAESKFAFSDGETTSRCPSLVDECPGPQTFDGFNDVGWVAMGGCCTLGVTWYGIGIDEADTALNTRFRWTTGSGSGYDVETVLLHEIGHTLGLDHSSVSGAVMYATYANVRRTLHEDDIRGVTYLYPETGATGEISGFVTSAFGAAISGANVTIAGLPVSATSSATGQFILSGIPDIGSYSITATASGYNGLTLNNVEVPSYDANFSLTAGGGSGGPCVPKSPNSNKCR